MKFRHVVAASDYDRWENERFTIARYSEWAGKQGTFFRAYDAENFSKALGEVVHTFDAAVSMCNAAA